MQLKYSHIRTIAASDMAFISHNLRISHVKINDPIFAMMTSLSVWHLKAKTEAKDVDTLKTLIFISNIPKTPLEVIKQAVRG